MKKQNFYTEMDGKEKREWWIALIGILCGIAGYFMALYYVTMALKSVILKN